MIARKQKILLLPPNDTFPVKLKFPIIDNNVEHNIGYDK